MIVCLMFTPALCRVTPFFNALLETAFLFCGAMPHA